MATDNRILVSLHGNRAGLHKDGSLIVDGVRVTNGLASAGAKNGSTVDCQETVVGNRHFVKLTCTATPVLLTDESATAIHGGVKVYDFPIGYIQFAGSNIQGLLTGISVLATWVGDVALGTVTATTGATLVSTEADIKASAAIAEATAKVGPVVALDTTITYLDGRTTAKDMFLNFIVDENAANATSTGAFTGTIEFTYDVIALVV